MLLNTCFDVKYNNLHSADGFVNFKFLSRLISLFSAGLFFMLPFL